MYKKFTLIIIASVILFGPIGQFIAFKFTPIYDLNLLTKLYDDASWVKGKPKIVIMGSSHARYHIIPKEIAKLNKGYEFKDIVNIGENAASPFEMYTSFMKNREKFRDVETVYYTLEPHMLGEKYYPYNKYEEILLSYEQWKYLELNHRKKNNYFFPFQTFIKSLVFETSNRSKANGYSALKHKTFNQFSKGKVLKQIYEPLELFPVSFHGIKYLKKLKEELDKQNTELIFVLTPTYTWQKFYANEAKEYDNMLIGLLNNNLGPIKIIGSFWPEDFGLEYKDFKDDTHMAYSGALKFTKRLFVNIKRHKNLQTKLLKNTFLYRFDFNETICNKRLIYNLNINTLDWKTKKYGKISTSKKYLEFNSSKIESFAYIHTDFFDINNSNEVDISIELPLEKLKMISISLGYNSDYAHFFLKKNDFNTSTIVLSKGNISRASKAFNFSNLNRITIRVYPKKGDTITNFKVKKIIFLTLLETVK